MSHVAAIGVKIAPDEFGLQALELACKELGLELRRGKRTYKWFGQWVNDYSAENASYKHGRNPKDYGKCDHAIGIPGDHHSYEVGVVPNPNGAGWILEYDFWSGGGGMSKFIEGVGPPGTAGKLVAAYAKHEALLTASRQGQSVSQQYDAATNELTIEVEDYEYN